MPVFFFFDPMPTLSLLLYREFSLSCSCALDGTLCLPLGNILDPSVASAAVCKECTQTLALWREQSRHFKRKPPRRSLLALLFLTCVPCRSLRLDNRCLQETDKPALGSKDATLKKNIARQSLGWEGREDAHSLPHLQEAYRAPGWPLPPQIAGFTLTGELDPAVQPPL